MASRRRPPGRPPPGTRGPPAKNRISSLTRQFGSTSSAPNISYTSIFSTAPPRTPPPEQPSSADWESCTPSQREQKQAEAWLKLSQTWEQWPDFDRSWEGVRHLGKGGAGSADLFRKIGSGGGTEGMPQYIVVKQANRSDKDLLSETLFLQLFMDKNTPHVLKIYRAYHEGEVVPPNIGGMFDIGRDNFQKRQKIVQSRIYLEFCEKGDVENWTADHVEKNGIILEEKVIWDIFECLARACIMLENGSESLDVGSGQDWIPVCHLDLKPANILIGNKDDSHDDIGIFKMGDFGLSAHVPHDSQDPLWLEHVASQLTLGWGAPEQFFPQMQNRSYSTPANIFGVAAIVYYLMTKQQVKIGQGMAYVGFPSLDSDNNIMPQVSVLTCGRDLLDNPMIKNSGIYSKSLIRTLLQCLAYYPNERMTARQLLDVCIKGRFLFGNMLEEYTYEDSQPATNYWPERAATSMGIPGNKDPKEHLEYYPPHELIAAEKEREERFLASFWVTPTRQIVPPASVSVNSFGSAGDLTFNSGSSAPFSFGQKPSSSQFNNSNLFQPGNNAADNSTSGSSFMFGQQSSSSTFNSSNSFQSGNKSDGRSAPGSGFMPGQQSSSFQFGSSSAFRSRNAHGDSFDPGGGGFGFGQ